MKIFNSLTKKYEEIDPHNTIRWYVCGPTVYDEAHLGHARMYVMNDIMIRIMRQMGYNVKSIMNITDIDDKILKRTKETYGDTSKHSELTQQYTTSFINDMELLGVGIPNAIERVTDKIDNIIDFIEKLYEDGFAYLELESIDGRGKSVYFDTTQYETNYPGYNFDEAKQQGNFDDLFKSSKKRSSDFVLWKGVEDTDIGWKSPWGKGRPGWHTECASFINDFNGIHIHTGGIDLRFPHHENELKQLQVTGYDNPLFMHIGHLHIDGQKMSKSEKNFTTIKDFVRGDPKRAIHLRFMFLQHHYNSTMSFSEEHFEHSQRQYHLLNNIPETIKTIINESKHKINTYSMLNETQEDTELQYKFMALKQKVTDLLCDDMQFNNVLIEMQMFGTEVLNYIHKTTKPYIYMLISIRDYYEHIFEIFGIKLPPQQSSDKMMDLIVEIRDIIRSEAKTTKNNNLWKLSDTIRNDMLKPMGYQIEDKSDGPSFWKRI